MNETVTTPESPDLQALLAVMLERGADVVAMEVSSHALALQRVDHVGFDVAAFTNLGRDHLDFHPTLEDYFEAKAKLFDAARRLSAIRKDCGNRRHNCTMQNCFRRISRRCV